MRGGEGKTTPKPEAIEYNNYCVTKIKKGGGRGKLLFIRFLISFHFLPEGGERCTREEFGWLS